MSNGDEGSRRLLQSISEELLHMRRSLAAGDIPEIEMRTFHLNRLANDLRTWVADAGSIGGTSVIASQASSCLALLAHLRRGVVALMRVHELFPAAESRSGEGV
jgi:hypothetical protein